MIRVLRFITLAATFVAAPVVSTTVAAAPIAPSIGICALGICYDMSSQIRTEGPVSMFNFTLPTEYAIITVSGQMDSDPFISFTVDTVIFADAVTFSFTLGTPIVSAPYNFATSSNAATVTPARADSTLGLAFYGNYLVANGMVGATATPLDLGTGTDFCLAQAGGPPVACTPTGASDTFAPTVYDGLQAVLSFTQTGAGGNAHHVTNVTITEKRDVPEPVTLSLIGLGAIGAFVRRRVRR